MRVMAQDISKVCTTIDLYCNMLRSCKVRSIIMAQQVQLFFADLGFSISWNSIANILRRILTCSILAFSLSFSVYFLQIRYSSLIGFFEGEIGF